METKGWIDMSDHFNIPGNTLDSKSTFTHWYTLQVDEQYAVAECLCYMQTILQNSSTEHPQVPVDYNMASTKQQS